MFQTHVCVFVALGTVVAPIQRELYNFARISLTHYAVMREVEARYLCGIDAKQSV